MKYTLLIVAFFLLPPCALAQENDAAEAAYCKNIMEQAAAQRDLLRSPSVTAGPVVPNSGTPPQLVLGVTNSLADDRKASLTMKAAMTTCNLYSATAEAQQHIYYALPKIERDVLRHRLDLIDQASGKLERLIAEDEKLVQAQNMTRPAVYYLQSARVRLDMSRTAALTGITSPYVPQMSDVPLRVLIGEKLRTEELNQQALDKLGKENGWDIALGGGIHRQLGDATYPSVSRAGAFAEFTLSYDLGRHSANKHLDNSVSAYMDWKTSQFDDVARQAVILKRQIEDTIGLQEHQLKTLLGHDAEIAKALQGLDGVDTATALAFRSQLLADQVVLQVDIDDVRFRLDLLQQYLASNL
ncbi:MAG: hypothetical protein ACLQVL_28245 [Terriglobia bacterium]